jgi:hypothetical protein
MPSPRVLTTTIIVAGAKPTDVRVVETRRPWDDETADEVHVQIQQGACAVQFYGTLAELAAVAAAITDGLTGIAEARR